MVEVRDLAAVHVAGVADQPIEPVTELHSFGHHARAVGLDGDITDHGMAPLTDAACDRLKRLGATTSDSHKRSLLDEVPSGAFTDTGSAASDQHRHVLDWPHGQTSLLWSSTSLDIDEP